MVSLRNLADPEVRYGLVFAPIDKNDSSYKEIFSSHYDISEKWFLGKPLHSNVKYIIFDDVIRGQLFSKKIDIDFSDFSNQDEGIICVADIASYGRALQYSQDNMGTFLQNTEEISRDFRVKIQSHLVEFARTTGTTQRHIAGDGLICTFPKRVFKDKKKIVEEIIEKWKKVIADIKQLNKQIKNEESYIGTRLVIHYGKYD